jgi:hypothetical protein
MGYLLAHTKQKKVYRSNKRPELGLLYVERNLVKIVLIGKTILQQLVDLPL